MLSRKPSVLVAFLATLASVTFLPLLTPPTAADGLETLYAAELGCHELRLYGTGLADAGAGTIDVPEGPGPIEFASLSWLGSNDTSPDDVSDGPVADSTLTINGLDVVGVQPAGAAAGTEHHPRAWWHAWSADVGADGAGLITDPKATSLQISDWDADPADPGGRNGAVLSVVYDTSPCVNPIEIEILNGVNYFFAGTGVPASLAHVSPVSDNNTTQITTVNLTHWGADSHYEGCRPTGLWLAAGSGAAPDGETLRLFEHKDGRADPINGGIEAVRNPFFASNSTCEPTLNPSPNAAPYSALAIRPDDGGFQGSEISMIDVDFLVPGGTKWMAVQLESSNRGFGESGAWGGAFAITSRPAAAVGDYVWLDTNSDGLQDANESGLPGIEVNLLESITGETVTSATTDATGRYVIPAEPGCYLIDFALPEGHDFTTAKAGADNLDSDAGLDGRTDEVCIGFDEYNFDQDAGIVAQASPPIAEANGGSAGIDTNNQSRKPANQDSPLTEGLDLTAPANRNAPAVELSATANPAIDTSKVANPASSQAPDFATLPAELAFTGLDLTLMPIGLALVALGLVVTNRSRRVERSVS